MTDLLAWAGRWMTIGSLALLDNALLSIATFVTQVVLVRALTPEQFGAFSVAYTAQMIVQMVVFVIGSQPMHTVGMQEHAPHLRRYLGHVLVLVTGTSLVASAMLLLTAIVLRNDASLTWAFAGSSIALPAATWLMTLRLYAYMAGRVRAALLSSIVALSVAVTALIGMHAFDGLSPFAGFLIVATSSSAAGLYLAVGFRLELRQACRPGDAAAIGVVLRRHVTAGGWMLGEGILIQVARDFYPFLLAAWSGLEAAAIFRALTTLAIPLQRLSDALTTLVQPRVSAGITTWRLREIASFSGGIAGLMLVTAAGFITTLAIFGDRIIAVLFDDPIYTAQIGLLPVILTYYAAVCAVNPSASAVLRARGRFDLVLYATAAGALAAVVLGLPLTARMGLIGAAISLAVSGVLTGLISGILLVNDLRSRGAIHQKIDGPVQG